MLFTKFGLAHRKQMEENAWNSNLTTNLSKQFEECSCNNLC